MLGIHTVTVLSHDDIMAGLVDFCRRLFAYGPCHFLRFCYESLVFWYMFFVWAADWICIMVLDCLLSMKAPGNTYFYNHTAFSILSFRYTVPTDSSLNKICGELNFCVWSIIISKWYYQRAWLSDLWGGIYCTLFLSPKNCKKMKERKRRKQI